MSEKLFFDNIFNRFEGREKEFEKMKEGAKMVIDSFKLKRSEDGKKGETLLIIVDDGIDPLLKEAFHEVGRESAGDDFRMTVIPKTEHAAQSLGETVGERMKNADAVLLLTSLSRTHAKETKEAAHPSITIDRIKERMNTTDYPLLHNLNPEEVYKILLKKLYGGDRLFPSNVRFISITNPKSFKDMIINGGAALENVDERVERIDKFAEAMEEVKKVHITGPNGTDLWVSIERESLLKDTGLIDAPGKAGNFPSGEYGSAANLE